MKRFLIIQTAFLGDVILATPVISELKRLYPSATIDVLVRKGNEGILLNHPSIRQVFTLDKQQGKWKEIRKLVRTFRVEKYDELINLQRFGSSGLISFLSGARIKVGFDKNPFSFCYQRKIKHEIGTGKHEVERNLECIASHGAQNLVRPQVFPSETNRQKVQVYTKSSYFVLAPASVWFTKQLPESKWIELAKTLSQKGSVYLVGAPSDFALCERIQQQAQLAPESNLAGKLNLLDSCALFEQATRCYVNDSGPLHMASAVNAPVTAFFCSTIPAFGFGPLSDDSQILETSEKLTCRPCGLHGFKACPQGHFKCGNIEL